MIGGIVWKDREWAATEPPLADRRRFEADRGIRPLAAEPGGVAIYVARRALEAIGRHARSSAVEQGGLLLGSAFRAAGEGKAGPVFFVDIALSLAATQVASTAVSFRFGKATWTELRRRWREVAPERDLVGWYHTHPGFGAFFSATDRATQRDFFARPWLVGLVVDTVRGEKAWFAGGASRPVRGWAAYDGTLAEILAASGLSVEAAVPTSVGPAGEIQLEGRASARIAGIVLPPRSARSKPLRKLQRRARRAIARSLACRRCGIVRAEDAGRTCGPVHVIVRGRLLAERLLLGGLARLVPAEASPFEALLGEAERQARARGHGIWRKKTRFQLDAEAVEARLRAARLR